MTWLLGEKKAPAGLGLYELQSCHPVGVLIPYLLKLYKLDKLDELGIEPPPAPALSKVGEKAAPVLLLLTLQTLQT